MMSNPRFEYDVVSVFYSPSGSILGALESALSLDSNNVFRRSLVVEVNNDEVEIPVIARSYFELMVSDNLENTRGIERIILPLY